MPSSPVQEDGACLVKRHPTTVCSSTYQREAEAGPVSSSSDDRRPVDSMDRDRDTRSSFLEREETDSGAQSSTPWTSENPEPMSPIRREDVSPSDRQVMRPTKEGFDLPNTLRHAARVIRFAYGNKHERPIAVVHRQPPWHRTWEHSWHTAGPAWT